MREQTREHFLTKGQREINMRGVGPEALRLIERYGLVPYMHEKNAVNNSRVLQRKLALLSEQARSLEQLEDSEAEILPRFTLAQSSNSFYFMSMRYTPQQFAESVMYYQHWRWYASVDYHPWGEKFALEIADNRHYHEYENIPMKDLVQKVLASLKAGHPVYWELGRKASVQKQGGGADSDHAMAIVGVRKTKGGYMLTCINSYGKKWGKEGRCQVSLDYFIKHTCNVGIME